MIEKKIAKEGDVLVISYVGKFENGEVFDSTGDNHFSLKLGETPLIKGFEKNLIGMAEGESKSFKVSPEEGYGNRLEELVIEMDKSNFPPNIPMEKGIELEVVSKDNKQKYYFMISEVKENSVILDGNHPLAGKTLFFDVKLEKIE